jgi:hypothetical protein
MITTSHQPLSPDSTASRFAVDTTEVPLAWPVDPWADPTVTHLEIDLISHLRHMTMSLPVEGTSASAGGLCAADGVAFCEETGDPHAQTDEELAARPDAEICDPGPGAVGRADAPGPAAVWFHIRVDNEGARLSTADLRAALVDHLAARFNVSRVAVSAGDVQRGDAWSFDPAAD